MALTREEYKERMRQGRERAAEERRLGLRPPRKNAAGNIAPPPADFTQSQEFKDAVQSALDDALAPITAKLAGLSLAQPAPTAAGGSLEEILSRLAMEMAELSGQAVGQPKPIPPQILHARKRAHDRMMEVLDEVQKAPQETEPPVYHLTSKITIELEGCGATLIEPLWRGADNRVYPTEIAYKGIPNLAMEPQNRIAKRIHGLFRVSIGNAPDTAFKMYDEMKAGLREPEPDQGIDRDFAATPNNHVVTGGAAALMRSRDRDRSGPGQNAGLAVVRNQGAEIRMQHGVAPYKDVRVLGTIVPPARQNG
jgi:hypothetical protein